MDITTATTSATTSAMTTPTANDIILPEDVKSKIDDIHALTKSLFHLAKKLYSGDLTHVVIDGQVIERRHLDSFISQLLAKIASLKKDVVALSKKKRKTNKTPRDDNRPLEEKYKGLLSLCRFRVELIEFFRKAKMPPAYKLEGNSYVKTHERITDAIPQLMNDRIASASMVNLLFNIYLKANKNIISPTNGQYIDPTQDPLFQQHFGQHIEVMMRNKEQKTQEDLANLQSRLRSGHLSAERYEASLKRLEANKYRSNNVRRTVTSALTFLFREPKVEGQVFPREVLVKADLENKILKDTNDALKSSN
jgi:hypothetical protein